MHKYSPGDKVLLRNKTSLVNEFGVNHNGEIRCGFHRKMMEYCGRVGVVVNGVYDMYSISFNPTETPFTYCESAIVRKVE